MTTITVRERNELVTEACADVAGIWRAVETGATRIVFDVYIDDERYATSPTREAAERVAQERRATVGLLSNDAATLVALALDIAWGEDAR